jgi:hypothetical protein
MKKQLLFLVAFAMCSSVYSQEIYLKTGKNATMYKYIDSDGGENNSFSTELGNAFEIGYSFPLKKFKGFSYDVALTLNGFNSIVGIPSANIRWKTQYAGVQNAISFAFVKSRRFAIEAKTGFNFSTTVYGKEEIDGVVYDLKDLDGYKGVTTQALFGLEVSFYASKAAYLTLSYTYLNSFNVVKYPASFVFDTNQIAVGVHLPLDTKENENSKN